MSKGDVSKNPVALIAGPTASGKSDLAIALALDLQAAGRNPVVINADSAQVYAELQVLTARPGIGEMRGVPHRLFGEWRGDNPCTAADWARAARREIHAAHEQGHLPILVGGTGLYIRTLLEGIAPIPPIHPNVRDEVRSLPVEEARAALEREDPERAAVLGPRDTTRIARALEIVRSTGRPMAHWQAKLNGGIGDLIDLAPLILLPEREWLYARCDRRFEMMMECGAIDEVERLMGLELPPQNPVMRAIGVSEIAGFIRGEWSRDAAIERGKIATRQYAKRQYTWLRNQMPQEWPRVGMENYVVRPHFEIMFA